MAKAQPITGLDAQAPTTSNARVILQQRLNDMYSYTPYVDNPDNIQELHDMRIAAKRVRYTLELFEEFLPAISKDFVQELARLQDELGALHDSEVMLTLLHQLLQNEEADSTRMQQFEEAPKAQPPVPLPSGIEQAILHPAHAPALSMKERHGLLSFLHRQEQRRAQSYALFRQHWAELERKHFHEAILTMLNSEW